MRARTKNNSSTRRMLSLWEPPDEAGSPVGVLATTYTLDTALFEEECLARFAGVQSDPARDGALYRIEREEKLAALMCATVVADIHHCAGRRSLRWDLLASRPATGVMHAKISLLAWTDRVRVIVASANLTVEGYRRNQECAAVLEFDRTSTDRSLLDPLLTYLREVLDTTSGVARARATGLLDWVDSQLPRSAAPSRGLQRRLMLVGPGRKSLFDQLDEHLPSARPEVAHVVSPFFDEALRASGPEARLWQMLRQRGEAEMHLHVAADYAPEISSWRLQVPPHVLDAAPKGRESAVLSLHPIRQDQVPTDGGPERRPLHSKMLTLRHRSWIAWLVGSSNFTSAGTGLAPYRSNYEANVLYVLHADEGDALYRRIEAGGLRGGDAVDLRAKLDFKPAFDDGENSDQGPPPLPAFFAEADLLESTDECHRLLLRFDGPSGPSAWWLRQDAETVYDHAAWKAFGSPATGDIRLSRRGPPPSVLQVEWQVEGAGRCTAEWPVNVRSASALPPPDELRGLTLTALLELLSSARPLHEALRDWLRRQPDDDHAEGLQGDELVDPHQKVDTSGFLIKRVQRACGALRQLRERLEHPLLSESALAWRLDGPVGARAVVDAMRRQCDPRLPDEWTFVLCGLIREIEPVRLRGAGGKAAEARLQRQLDTFVREQRQRLQDALPGASAAMRAYVESALPGGIA